MRFTLFEEASGYCGKCLKQVPVYRVRVRHLLYLIVTLCTLGVWAIFWLREIRKIHPWICLDCGATVYKIMS